ncbi:MAG: plasmid stabilization system protein ParE [Bacteroidia bacterium]|jgi:plasmid stabilization system protein ParE
MAEVVWTKKAFSQLERAIEYIETEQGNAYASIVLNRILKDTNLLKGNPRLGTKEPLLSHKTFEYRFLVVWSYKIIVGLTAIRLLYLEYFTLPEIRNH